MSIIPRDCRKYIESDPTTECGCVQCKQDEETRRQIKAQAPSTSKCCEKCYDPYSTQGYEVDSPCGNPDCPCHTTHNQEEGVIVRDLTIDILPQYKVERLGTLQEAVEETKEGWEKEFDEKFSVKDDSLGKSKYESPTHYSASNIKSFISKVRQSAIQEERERLAGLIEKINRPTNEWGNVILDKDLILHLIRTNTK